MKISRRWLRNFFDAELPDAQALADALTFHVFEIDGVEKVGDDDVLDVKVTPNRGHDCLSHLGIAKELSAILKIPLKPAYDGFTKPVLLEPKTDAVSIVIEEPQRCARYIAGYVRGVKVGPSPEWLVQALAAVGQRSINNIVDATNFVMFDIGQPLHAFDAAKLGSLAIGVRRAKSGETMEALDTKSYDLTDSMLVITAGDAPVGIAGVKGGMATGIDEKTTDIVIESANFDGVSVRKTAAALKLRTDASQRFEQVLSPELAAVGMRQVVDLIGTIAGGEIAGFVDVYPTVQSARSVSVSLAEINDALGTSLTLADVEDVWKRLSMIYHTDGTVCTIEIPPERLDLAIPEDLIEEVARIVGYDAVPSTALPAFSKKPEVNPTFYAAEHTREALVAKGYSEVFTSVFADAGERVVANKVDSVRPYLRSTLIDGLTAALEKNMRNKDLLGLSSVKLFEIGTVWIGGSEKMMLGIADAQGVREEPLNVGDTISHISHYEDAPVSRTERYQPFSRYPFIVRDIALWVEGETSADAVLGVIRLHAGDLLVRSEKFDEFKKGEKISYAFRLVFQSFERTLTDDEVQEVMERVYAALAAKGWVVR